MGAESSKGAAAGAQATAGGQEQALRVEIRSLQERVRELETTVDAAANKQRGGGAGAGAGHAAASAVSRAWAQVLGREPVLGVVRLSPESCAAADRLFSALDVNGDGVLDAADIPTQQGEMDVRGRAARLFQPLSDFLVRGEMRPEDLRRALAARAARCTASPPAARTDSLAGWVATIQEAANGWVQRAVGEVLLGGAVARPAPSSHELVSPPAPGTGGEQGVDAQPPCECVPVVALAAAFSNLGFCTTHDEILASASMPMWALRYARMSLGEAFHVARLHAEQRDAGLYLSMQHPRVGVVSSEAAASELEAFRSHLRELAAHTLRGDAVAVVILEPSTALGHRDVDGRAGGLSNCHAVLLEAYDAISDEVQVLDAQPRRYSQRWCLGAEQLHLACCALALHDHAGGACGGLLTLSRTAVLSSLTPQYPLANGQNMELLASPSGHPDCFTRSAPWMPTLPIVADPIRCHGLVALCAGLSVLEAKATRLSAPAGRDPPAPGWPRVDSLCHQLSIPIAAVMDNQHTLAELADMAAQWIAMRPVAGDVDAIHCDDRIQSVQAMVHLLHRWQSLELEQRPVYLVQYDSASLGASAAPGQSLVRLAFVVHFDGARSEVTVGECSVRHRASTWTLSVDALWRACEQVGNLRRSGGILSLNLHISDGQQHQAGRVDLWPMFSVQPPQVDHPIAAIGITSIAMAVEVVLQAASTNVPAASTMPILSSVPRPITVDDIVCKVLPTATVTDDEFSMAQAFDASVRYVKARELPVRVDVHFFDGGISEAQFREDHIKRVIASACREILVLHFSVELARNVRCSAALGNAALVAGYDETTDEVLLVDCNPKAYRAEWRAAVSTLHQACSVKVATAGGRARGAIRYSALSKQEALVQLQQHAAAGIDATRPAPAASNGVVSSQAILRPLAVERDMLEYVTAAGPRPLKAVAFSMGVADHKATAVDVLRACGIPTRSANASNWRLADLAAVARQYIERTGLQLDVQQVNFPTEVNTSERFRKEMERTKSVAASESHVFAYNPSVAHSAPALAGCDYCVLASVDINAATIEITDMNPKKNCFRWTCRRDLMFEAISGRHNDTYGMLRIFRKGPDAAENMFMDASPMLQLLQLDYLSAPPDAHFNHGALVLQMAIHRHLKVDVDTLWGIDSGMVTAQDTTLTELRDFALLFCHQYYQLHAFQVNTVHCEPAHCSLDEFSMEMRRHSEAVAIGYMEATVLRFNAGTLFGDSSIAAMKLCLCDWGMCVHASEDSATVVTFDGAEHTVAMDKLYTACCEDDSSGYSARNMGFFRLAPVTAANVYSTVVSTELVDGPIAWALFGDRVAIPPPPTEEVVQLPPDPVTTLDTAGLKLSTYDELELHLREVDLTRPGALTLPEVSTYVARMWSPDFHQGAVANAFVAADTNKDGVISRDEFASLLRGLVYYKVLAGAFAKIDAEESCGLSREEFGDALDLLDPHGVPQKMSQKQAESLYSRLLSGESGQVPMHELCRVMATRHNIYDGKKYAETEIVTESKMLHPADGYFRDAQGEEGEISDASLGQSAGVAAIASLIPHEYVVPVPCTALVAIGVCCDALSLLDERSAEEADGMGSRLWAPHQPQTSLDSIFMSISRSMLGVSESMRVKQVATLQRPASFQRSSYTWPAQSTVSVGLTLATKVARKLFAARGMAFAAEVSTFHRNRPADEQTFASHLARIRAAQQTASESSARGLSIVFFNANIAHASQRVGGCAVGIIADASTNYVVIADMLPKKFGRFWKCSIKRLYRACVNQEDNSAEFGLLHIKTGSVPASIAPGILEPTIERRRWRRAILCVVFGLRVQHSASTGRSKSEVSRARQWTHFPVCSVQWSPLNVACLARRWSIGAWHRTFRHSYSAVAWSRWHMRFLQQALQRAWLRSCHCVVCQLMH
jgi:hypothetical protein